MEFGVRSKIFKRLFGLGVVLKIKQKLKKAENFWQLSSLNESNCNQTWTESGKLCHFSAFWHNYRSACTMAEMHAQHCRRLFINSSNDRVLASEFIFQYSNDFQCHQYQRSPYIQRVNVDRYCSGSVSITLLKFTIYSSSIMYWSVAFLYFDVLWLLLVANAMFIS